MQSASITIVLLYGIFEKSNQQYKDYLDKALALIKQSSEQKIILCGGASRKDFPLTEAMSVRNYFVEQEPKLEGALLLEEKSLTTPQNLNFTLDLLKVNSIAPSSITIICDSIRAPKVYYFALTYLASLLKIQVSEEQIYRSLLMQFVEHRIDITQDMSLKFDALSVKGIWLNRAPKELGEQIVTTMEEIGAHHYPSLEDDIIAIRKRQLGIE